VPKGKKRREGTGAEPENYTQLNDFMAKFIKDVTKSIEGMEGSKQPMIYGFNIRIDQNGMPVVDRFGNLNRQEASAPQRKDEREPLVDIIESEKALTVVVELPGVSKEQITLESTESMLMIDAKSINRSYHKEIQLPKAVNPETAKAKYNNGVLEVTFRRGSRIGKPKLIPIA
jgi:HSP20 family protein